MMTTLEQLKTWYLYYSRKYVECCENHETTLCDYYLKKMCDTHNTAIMMYDVDLNEII